jgi:hypothetical protein
MELLMWLFALAACVDPLPDDTPYVTEPRVLAVLAEPPEAPPGSEVVWRAVTADADTVDVPLDLRWAWCRKGKPLAELGPVAPSCLTEGSEDLSPFGEGEAATSTVPDDACARFGPNPPPPEDGQPAGRPTDPDVTGGFHQPAVIFGPDDPTLAAARVRCGLANVS